MSKPFLLRIPPMVLGVRLAAVLPPAGQRGLASAIGAIRCTIVSAPDFPLEAVKAVRARNPASRHTHSLRGVETRNLAPRFRMNSSHADASGLIAVLATP